jgi:CPA1 family monovalent cation:H+ antiporter
VSSGQLLIVLSAGAVTLLAVAVLRRAGIPASVVLVVAGLVIGFLPFVPDASLQPEVVLLGLLPLLVYDAAITSSPTGFFRHARSIGTLAVPLVVVTAAAVAAAAHWLGHLSWPMALVLGTAVGPTDAAAAISVLRRLGLPRRLLTILEGEALFNDATALVLYAAAVTAATSGHVDVTHTVGSIFYSVVVGVVIGLAVGLVGRFLRNRIDDPPIEIAGSMLLAYMAYLPAEVIHASGVLAAVTAGLYLGWHSSGGAFSARSRLQSRAFWETLVFLVNAALFVLVGLSFHTFRAQARGPLGQLVLTAVLVVTTVMAVRLVWMWAFGWLIQPSRPRARSPRRSRPGRRPSGPRPPERLHPQQRPWRERLILGWSGMRGAITLAALLAVPKLTSAGQPLPGRDDIIYIGFAVIIGTLVVQGLTLPVLVRRLRVPELPSVADTDREARVELARAALDHIGEACDRADLPQELADGLRAQYLARIHRLQTSGDDELTNEVLTTARAELAMRRELISVQRRKLTALRDEGRIGITTLRGIEHDLDLEEARLLTA